MKCGMLKRLILTTFFVLLYSCSSTKSQMIFLNIESFRSQLDIGVVEEKSLDINNDGKMDFLVFTSGGEEIFLNILVKENDHLVGLEMPVAENYEIIGSSGCYEIKIGYGTFPSYGDIHGSDKYLWYDFYEILGHSLKQTNSRHPEFYKKMIPLYQHRIQELEAEIQSIMEEKSKDVSEASVLELFTQLKRDHMKRYREFIRKASGIIRRSK